MAAAYEFKDNDVIVPLVVVEEIDKFKRDQTEVGRNARTVRCVIFLVLS